MAITTCAVLIGFIADESLHTFLVVGAVNQSRFKEQMHSDKLATADNG
jgi:predicted phosphoadenosine phosphosulfate sulfurtransferase